MFQSKKINQLIVRNIKKVIYYKNQQSIKWERSSQVQRANPRSIYREQKQSESFNCHLKISESYVFLRVFIQESHQKNSRRWTELIIILKTLTSWLLIHSLKNYVNKKFSSENSKEQKQKEKSENLDIWQPTNQKYLWIIWLEKDIPIFLMLWEISMILFHWWHYSQSSQLINNSVFLNLRSKLVQDYWNSSNCMS